MYRYLDYIYVKFLAAGVVVDVAVVNVVGDVVGDVVDVVDAVFC